MTALSTAARFDRAFFARLADLLAVAVAVSLPWSTSATGILIALWLVVVLATLDPAALKRELVTAAGGLPVLLWCLGAVGMLWADVSWIDRLQGLSSFSRLLIIPLLLTQFRRSERGRYVIYGFFASSAILLIVSLAQIFAHAPTQIDKIPGIPVHDDILQSTEFVLCAFGLLGFACCKVRKRHWAAALGLFAAAGLFVIDLSVVVFSRIAPVAISVLVILLGWRFFRWRGVLGACGAAIVLGAVAWIASPNIRERVNGSVLETNLYRASDAVTPIGVHVAFLKESFSIITSAPVIGHGTGSISEQFRRVTEGESGAAAVVAENPHNQTFAVAIQIGLIGAGVLWSMWIAHLLLFRGHSLTAWLGLVVVVENIVFSTVHSALFDFASGWLYIFSVGVLAGMVLKESVVTPAKAPHEL
jgi:O-antigen ligase